MSLNAKPFNVAEKIIKRIFKGKPNIYADVDINQAIEVDENAFNNISEALGGLTTNFSPSISSVVWNSGGLSLTLAIGSGGKLKYKKVVFDIPATNYSTVGQIPAATIDDAIVNVYLKAEKIVTDFSSDPTIGGIDGVGLTSPLPSSDAVRYTNESTVITIGKDNVPTPGTGEEIIVLLCQVAFRYKIGNYLSVEPYLLINTPDISTLDATFRPDSAASASNVTGIIGNLIKLVEAFKNFFSGTAGDFLLYNGSANRYLPTNFDSTVFDRIRNNAHTFTKVQTYSRATGTFNAGTNTITLPGTGNNFLVVAGTGNIKQIVFNDGGPDYQPPVGTIIHVTVLPQLLTSVVTMNLDVTTGSKLFAGSVLQPAAPNVVQVGTEAQTYGFLYLGTDYWMLISRDYEREVSLLQLQIVNLALTVSSNNTTLQNQLNILNPLAPLTTAWTLRSNIADVTIVGGTSPAVTSSNIRYKIVGKTMFISFNALTSCSQHPNTWKVLIPEGKTWKDFGGSSFCQVGGVINQTGPKHAFITLTQTEPDKLIITTDASLSNGVDISVSGTLTFEIN